MSNLSFDYNPATKNPSPATSSLSDSPSPKKSSCKDIAEGLKEYEYAKKNAIHLIMAGDATVAALKAAKESMLCAAGCSS